MKQSTFAWRRRALSQSSTISQAIPPSSQIDLWASRVANLSQIGLLALGIFGYVYTVLPVYQKSLLDEEIAKKTLELATKEELLRQKTSELEAVNAAALRAQTELRRAKSDVGRLQGTVHSQYKELQPRVLDEFQLLARKLCKLSAIPDGTFAQCVQDKVMSTVNMAPLSDGDRSQLKSVLVARNGEIYQGWHDYMIGVERVKEQAQTKLKDAADKCEAGRRSEEYKDRIKRITIDHECEVQKIGANSEVIQGRIRGVFQEEEYLQHELIGIVQEFYRQGGAR